MDPNARAPNRQNTPLSEHLRATPILPTYDAMDGDGQHAESLPFYVAVYDGRNVTIKRDHDYKVWDFNIRAVAYMLEL